LIDILAHPGPVIWTGSFRWARPSACTTTSGCRPEALMTPIGSHE